MSLLDQLRDKRASARSAAEAVLTRSAESGEPMTGEDLAEHGRAVADEREAADAIEAWHADQLAEIRASVARTPAQAVQAQQPVLTREQSYDDWCRTRGLYGDEDAANLSFDRWLRGVSTGDWTGADHERALAEGTAAAGGVLVPTPLSARVIDLMRNASIINRIGATTVPMTTSTVKIPKLTGEGTPAWKTENAGITAADLTFGSLTLTAQTLVRLVTISVELYEDADPSAGDVVARSFAGQMAVELDRVALVGTGTAPEPRGVLNQSGVTLLDHAANGTAIGPQGTGLGYDFLVDAVAAVRANNFEPTAQVDAPRTEASLSKLKDSTNQYVQPPPGLPPRYASKTVPTNVTTGTSTDTSYLFTADWSQLAVGLRTAFNIKFLDQRYVADTLSYAWLAYLRADIGVFQAGAFAVDRGVRA